MLRTRTIGRLILALSAASGIALAQRPVTPPPAAKPPAPPPAAQGDRTIGPSTPESPASGNRKLSCDEVKRKAKFAIYFSHQTPSCGRARSLKCYR